MNFEFFLAKRFLAGQRFGVFRLVTTAIAIGGTALGVAALLVTLAVMDGFRTDIQDKILGTQPHLVVKNPFGSMLPTSPSMPGVLEKVPHVLAASPYIETQTLLQTKSRVTGILVRGIIPNQEERVTKIGRILTKGNWDLLNDQTIVLGRDLADSVSARLGDTITLIAPQRQSASWMQTPRMRTYKVVGIFLSGMYEYDANLAYLTIGGAQNLLGTPGNITGYGMKLDDLDHTTVVTEQLQAKLGPDYWVRSWQDMFRPLFSAMVLERRVMFLIVALIILVSTFTIISNLLLLTIEKAREIGILQALGASPNQISRIFLLNGLMLGGGGVSIGLALGIGLSEILKRFPIVRLPADVYNIDRVPVRLTGAMIGSVAACAFILVLLSILYPARKAREMDPVQAIRYG